MPDEGGLMPHLDIFPEGLREIIRRRKAEAGRHRLVSHLDFMSPTERLELRRRDCERHQEMVERMSPIQRGKMRRADAARKRAAYQKRKGIAPVATEQDIVTDVALRMEK